MIFIVAVVIGLMIFNNSEDTDDGGLGVHMAMIVLYNGLFEFGIMLIWY